VLRIAFEAVGGGEERLAASRAVGDGPVRLRVDWQPGGTCRFSAAVGDDAFEPLGPPFVAAPGRWVGAKVGLFAVAAPGDPTAGHADVAWFRVLPVF
jgi:hypothetical protein